MQLCQPCWAKLKVAIEQRGLLPLVAKDSASAAKRLAAQAEGATGLDNYDPMLAATFAIWGNAISGFGMVMLHDNPCPLCYKTAMEAGCTNPECSKQTGDDWIRIAADAQLEFCQKSGLVSLPA